MVTDKPIYSPRYFQSGGGGFFVTSETDVTGEPGIDGSGNFVNGTIAGASDAEVTNWNEAHGWGDHAGLYLTSLGTAIVDSDFGGTAGFCKVTSLGAYTVDTNTYSTMTTADIQSIVGGMFSHFVYIFTSRWHRDTIRLPF